MSLRRIFMRFTRPRLPYQRDRDKAFADSPPEDEYDSELEGTELQRRQLIDEELLGDG